MKKILLLIMVIMCLTLASCSSSNITSNESKSSVIQSGDSSSATIQTQNNELKAESEQLETNTSSKKGSSSVSNEKIEVEKGLLSVTITLPASLVGEDYKPEENADDYQATKNSDGSVTIKMTKSKHKEMMKQLSETALSDFEDLKKTEGYEFVKDVSCNSDFSVITYTVDRAVYDTGFNAAINLRAGITGMMYQTFLGVNSDKLKVTINDKDQATGDIFNTVIYPDAMNQ